MKCSVLHYWSIWFDYNVITFCGRENNDVVVHVLNNVEVKAVSLSLKEIKKNCAPSVPILWKWKKLPKTLPYFKLNCPELNHIELKVERKDREGLFVVANRSEFTWSIPLSCHKEGWKGELFNFDEVQQKKRLAYYSDLNKKESQPLCSQILLGLRVT